MSATNPTSGQAGVAVNTAVTATFSEAVKGVSTNTFQLRAGAAIVNGAVTLNGTTATFTPSANLAYSTTYTATVTTGVTDLANDALAAHSWSFTTAAGSVDSDNDGIGDAEDDYPGDARKATPRSATGAGKIVIDTSQNGGTRLASVVAMSDTDPTLNQSGKPAGFTFDYGVLTYRVEGVAPGATIQVKIMLPADIPPGSKAFKVDSNGFHEYARVSFQDRTMTVTLTDGGEGDSDGNANDVVADPIGLATPAESPQATAPADAAGGGCSISGTDGKGGTAAASYGMLLLLATAVLGARAAIRKTSRR